MYIWYLLYCLRSLETTDCAYEDIPQDSHWYSPAVSEGYLFVARRHAETLYHSAWVPRWDVLGLNGLQLLYCLNWQDLKHVRIKNFLEEAALAWSLR